MIKTRFLYMSFIFALMIASYAIEVPQSSVNTPDPTAQVVVTNSGTDNNETTW
jgi:hypothetical protein